MKKRRFGCGAFALGRAAREEFPLRQTALIGLPPPLIASYTKRIGPTLLVRLRSPIGCKPHFFVKAHRLRILLVDRHFIRRELFGGEGYKGPPDPLSALLGRDEQHLDPPSLHAQKGCERAVPPALRRPDGRRLQRPGDIRPDACDLALRQKVMRRPDGGFPNGGQALPSCAASVFPRSKFPYPSFMILRLPFRPSPSRPR